MWCTDIMFVRPGSLSGTPATSTTGMPTLHRPSYLHSRRTCLSIASVDCSRPTCIPFTPQ